MNINLTSYLHRADGRIAYDVSGHGPLIVCVPGMGEVRASFRQLAPGLVAAGYRVATMDLRGHGESDASFDAYDDPAAGSDVLALIKTLDGGPAVVVGNSMGAAAAAWAAAEAPDLVAGLALIGPFVRNPPTPAVMRLAFRLGLLRPWGPAVWHAWHGKLFATTPADHAEHRAAVKAALGRPAYWKAFTATSRLSHSPVEERLGEVKASVLVVMGEQDPDFPDPATEAAWIAERLDADTVMVPDAGHYPQAERPDVVTPAVLAFLSRVIPGA